MRSSCLTLLAAAISVAPLSAIPRATLGAQGAGGAAPTPPTQSFLPLDVRREVVARWNGPNALRASGRLEIGVGREVTGNLAVEQGELVLAGHVAGSVTAVNATVVLGATARIDGDLLVVGGGVEGRNAALVGGPIRIYREPMIYHEEGDKLVDDVADSASAEESWLRRLEHHHQGNWVAILRVVQAGPYNRVEGLPIELGPVVNHLTPWGSVRADAAAVVRTGSSFGSTDGDVGHRLRGEVRVGRVRGIGVGAQLFNIVDAVESWQLSDLETALAAFVVRRDYRDYYQRHGGNAFVTLYGARTVESHRLVRRGTLVVARLRNPFTLFNADRDWRPNPLVDEGLFHVGTLSLNFDTRTDPEDPWSGWLVDANLEYGTGTIEDVAPSSEPRPLLSDGHTRYTRGFFDFRRYNRLGPTRSSTCGCSPRAGSAATSCRSSDGFRSTDRARCPASTSAARAPVRTSARATSACSFRGGRRSAIASRSRRSSCAATCRSISRAVWEDWPHHYHSSHGDAVWVVFADAGRGWNVGPIAAGTPLGFGTSTIPPFSTFRTDVGVGLDFGGIIGVYAAKSTSSPSEPMNFFVRLRHRF